MSRSLFSDEKAVPVDREPILSTTIYFAGMFPSWPRLEDGTRLALDHINNDSSILPGYTLDMVTGDSKVRFNVKE